MDLFDGIAFLGGLAFFLFGMTHLSSGLETIVGGKFEKSLTKMTSNRVMALVLGAVVTAMVQSSSAVTVILVGLVNSNIMTLTQSVGVIMGSNIGTTITSWILSLMGLESSNFFVKMLKPDSFAPVIAAVGVFLIMFTAKKKNRNIGNIFLGFAILISGMSMMSDAVSGLKDVPEFQNLMVTFSNPIMGVLVGIIITAAVQSSSASVGILQSLSLTGAIPFSAALPIIMGQNIGTCITALISSIGANRGAKRVTAVHIYFNLIGTLVCLPIFLIVQGIFQFEFFNTPASPLEIAITHSTFNVITTAMLFPFAKHLQKLAELTVKGDSATDGKKEILDERLLVSPSFAIAESRTVAHKMARTAQETILLAVSQLSNFNPKQVATIEDNETSIDTYEDKIGSYLVKISSNDLSEEDSKSISQLLHSISDFERIGDHALNILDIAKEIHDKDLKFSDKAKSELNTLISAVTEILNNSIDSFVLEDSELAFKVEPLEEVIDELTLEIKHRHIKRLKKGNCTIELGFVLNDILTNLERVSDHCSNIAICQLEVVGNSSFDTHEYVAKLRSSENNDFNKAYAEYSANYKLVK